MGMTDDGTTANVVKLRQPGEIDKPALAEFLQLAFPEGETVQLFALCTETDSTVTQTFLTSAVTRIAAWVARFNQAKHNIYWTPNEVPSSLARRARADDVTAARFCWVDLDPDPAVTIAGRYAEERGRLLALADQLSADASFVIDSGNGIQAFWRLKINQPVSAWAPIEKALCALHGGDSVHDASRLMKLPGCTVWPTPRKVKKGYPNRPTFSRLIVSPLSVGDVELDLLRGMLPDTEPAAIADEEDEWWAETHARGVSDRDESSFETVLSTNQKFSELWYSHGTGDGSRDDMSLCAMLVAEGLTQDAIRSIVSKWPHGSTNGRAQGDRYWDRMFERTLAVPGSKAHSGAEGPALSGAWFELADTWCDAPIRADIVKGVVPAAEFGIIYGKSTAGKSFAAIDLGYAIAMGTEWRGLKVKQRPVFYLAAEAADGVRRRVKAYRKANDVPDGVPFHGGGRAANLFTKNAWQPIAANILELSGGEPGVIFIDTLARTMVGAEENSAKDMGVVVDNCQLLAKGANCLVIAIAHAGKDDDKGVRGSSALRAAADFEICVERAEGDSGWRCLRLTKSKDGEDGHEFAFKLTGGIEVGVDEDGCPVTSAVVEHTDEPRPEIVPVGRRKQAEKVDEFEVDTRFAVQRRYLDILRKNGVMEDEWMSARKIAEIVSEDPFYEDKEAPTTGNIKNSLKSAARLGKIQWDGASGFKFPE